MNQLLILMATMLLSAGLLAGDKETRSLNKFDGVKVSSGISTTMVASSENKIDIDAHGIDLDRIKSDVSNGTLKVTIDQKWWKSLMNRKQKIKVTIYYTEAIEAIGANAGASIECQDVIKNDLLTVDVSSGSMVDLEIEANELRSDISSGASLYIEGSAHSAWIDIASGSSFKGNDLSVDDASIEASSGSSVKLEVAEELNADVSSGASVRYAGSPTLKNIDKSSGGSVSKM